MHKLLRLTDLANLQPEGFPELRDPPHVPVDHPRMAALDPGDTDAIFDEIRKGDILLQDSAIIRELYLANQAGVPIILNVRGLCWLRAGVPRLVAPKCSGSSRTKCTPRVAAAAEGG